MEDNISCTKCGATVMTLVSMAMICAFGAKMSPDADTCIDGKSHDLVRIP